MAIFKNALGPTVNLPDEGVLYRDPEGQNVFIRQGGTLNAIRSNLLSGVNVASLPVYTHTGETAQALGMLGGTGGGTQVTDPTLFQNLIPKTGEIISRSPSVQNPQGADILSNLTPSVNVTTPSVQQNQASALAQAGGNIPLPKLTTPSPLASAGGLGTQITDPTMQAFVNKMANTTPSLTNTGGFDTSATAQQRALEKIRGAFQATTPEQTAALSKITGAFGGGTTAQTPQAQISAIQSAGGTAPAGTTGGTETGIDPNLKRLYELALGLIGTGEIPESEKTKQAQIDALTAQQAGVQGDLALRTAALGTLPIAQPIISGHQAEQLRLASAQMQGLSAQAVPLQTQLAREQEARQRKQQAALDVAKTGVEYGFKTEELNLAKQKEAREAAKPVEGFTLGEKQKRFDAAGNLIASNVGPQGLSGGVSGNNSVVDAYADAVLTGKTKLENIPTEDRGAVAEAIKGKEITPETSPYLAQIAVNGRQAVSGLKTIADRSPGIFGRTAAAPWPDALRSDDFRNYEAQLDYLKGNIIPAALTAMREASKTGGALGQVSDREGAWLASSLGALSMSQSPDMVRQQLVLIDESLARWQKAVIEYGAGKGKTSGGNTYTVTQK